MEKGKKLCAILSLSLTIVGLSGCAIPGVTEPLDEGNGIKDILSTNKSTTAEEETIDPFDFDKVYIPEDKTIYNIGDTLYPKKYLSDFSTEEVGSYMQLTINSATVYEHAYDAGIDESEFCDDSDIYKQLSPFQPKLIEKDIAMSGRFLLCDISIKYEDFFLEENADGTDNITFLNLIYVYDDGSYVTTGNVPFYLSNHGYNYTNFDIGSDTINLQVGWIIDKEIFELDEFDVSKLYLIMPHRTSDERLMEFVYLGLK
jgi:uncharacterized protein YktA (UPF0223 family)